MPRALTVCCACCALLPACVIGRPARQSLPESAEGPSGAPVSGAPVAPRTLADESELPSPTRPPTPKSAWARGYWHWDGIRYVWERGHWEPTAAN